MVLMHQMNKDDAESVNKDIHLETNKDKSIVHCISVPEGTLSTTI